MKRYRNRENLKLEDPILPSKAWESIPSESGGDGDGDGGGSRPSDPGSGSGGPPIYDPWTVSESHLVRLVMNALQGAKSAIDIIEKLSTTFCSTPADRSSHRIPSLWHRSTSTAALGNILKSLGRSGLLVFLLQKFVDYFQNPHLDGGSKNEVLRKGNPMGHEFSKDESTTMNGVTADVSELERCGCHSLVNQAFSVAVRRVLEGYICALNTLFASAQLRRSSNSVNPRSYESWGAVGLTRDAYSSVTLLEVYVHTKELRSQIESLGNVCLSKTAALISGGDLVSDTNLEFHKFPRGADLLTYLYVQLRDSDPVHSSLLKFLFVHSCEPYCGFIKSWIYRARINDPHKEFMVEYLDELPSSCTNGLLQSCKERDGVSVPCFLKDICSALLRAGQQLQILIKLLEMCNISPVEDHGRGKDICFSYDSANLEDVLPFWSGSLSDRDFFSFSLTFRQRNIEAMTTKRELIYTTLQVKLENLFKRLSRYRQATAFGTLSNFLSRRRGIDMSFSNKLMFDKGSISHTSQIHKDFSDVILDEDDSDISGSSDESLCGVEPLDTSECSSSHEEHVGLTCLDNGNALYKTFETERPWELDCILQRKHVNTCSISPVRQQQNHVDLNNIKLSYHSQESHTGKSEVTYVKCPDYHMDGEKEHFNMYRRFNKKKLNSVIDGNHNQGNENMEIIELDDSYFNKPFVSDKSEFEPVGMRIPLENAACGASPYCLIHQQWNSKYNHRTFNVNPMLSKATWTSFMYNSRDSHTKGNQRFSLQCFNFSSVEDPCESYKMGLIASPASEIQVDDPHVMDSKIHMTINDKEEYTDHDFLVDQSDQSVSCSLSSCSSRNLKSDLNPEDPPNICGGSNWESSLQVHSGKDFVARMDRGDNCMETFDMPQDIVIEKCIRQEILLQYKFVSGFTIKLLEEGFNLREHLLALRRYHFMELGDWADSFISSLWHHKWRSFEVNQRISEIQGLLDLALCRSSCERDEYKDRLFINTKGHDKLDISSPQKSVHAFDFLALGYRVDWPIKIVVTRDALNMYEEIFRFLVRVKLAASSLTDIWHSTKAQRLIGLKQGLGHQDMKFNTLLKLRQRVNHFVSTLQQYVQSQLSHASWCRFLYSLKHQVKDTTELEKVHMSYLADSSKICFLSTETRPVARIIENILQCALDFWSCYPGGCNVRFEGQEFSNLIAQMNFSQVLAVEAKFEKNIKELYVCYLRSPKHGQFALCCFWGYLNYNEYYSDIIGKGEIL